MIKILNVVGARPNFMKIAPLMDAYRTQPEIRPVLLHTGQHYDERMSDLFFRELGIPEPEINLGVGSGSHAQQTAQIMTAFEVVIQSERPDAVLVVGDVNSTIACGLVAVKAGIKLVHVEAGLRSFDRTMPEEINRLCTDAISDLLFCTEQSAVDNLRREGVPDDRIFLVGNLMIDTLLKHRAKADASQILDRLGLSSQAYAVVTLHRPSNVDNPEVLSRLLDVLKVVQGDMPVVFPIHPRTRKNLSTHGLLPRLSELRGLQLVEPLGYLDFLKLSSNARVVFTDSGGIQEETTILRVPCITLRANTERPITTEVGSSYLVGNDPDRILDTYSTIMQGRARVPQAPPLWDGGAAIRTVSVLTSRLTTL
jgi:UDP-N-acetylglucosamine 2-epimerase (non-hydrolysing)